jgi:hypothetical protein
MLAQHERAGLEALPFPGGCWPAVARELWALSLRARSRHAAETPRDACSGRLARASGPRARRLLVVPCGSRWYCGRHACFQGTGAADGRGLVPAVDPPESRERVRELSHDHRVNVIAAVRTGGTPAKCPPRVSTRMCVNRVVCYRRIIGDMRLGIADHLGWAIAVTASADHEVVDRRRIELIEPGISPAPIHYESRRLDVAATAALVAQVRASVVRATSAALDEIATALPAPVLSISLRAWPLDFPDDIAVQRRAPYEARADAIMYRQELSELAHARGWDVHVYDAKAVVGQAVSVLAERADEVLQGPRATMGPPWTKDHRVALAATIVAADTVAQRESAGCR